MPWIVRLPGLIRPGSECELSVITADISPTILDLCGLMPRTDLHLDGISIMPLLKGKRKPIHEALHWHFPHYGNTGSRLCISIRSGNWKLIEWLENGDVELFGLANDESETKNLAASNQQFF